MFACQSENKEGQQSENDAEALIEDAEAMLEEATEQVTDMTTSEAKSARGQVKAISEANDEGMTMLTVSHEAIPDFMKAMQMDFKAESQDAQGLKEGDKISFEMVKTENGFRIQNIEKLPADTDLELADMM